MDETLNQSTITLQKDDKLEKISFIILGVLIFLLPFFFIPAASFPLLLSKNTLLSTGIVIALALYIISLIKAGEVRVPKNLFLLSAVLLPAVFFVSSVFNGMHAFQFLGFGFEVGTVASLFFAFILLFLVSEIFQSKERIFYGYLAFFASFAVVSLFHIIKFLSGSDFLGFGVLTSSAANAVGNWNDLGIFLAVSAILSLVTLEMLELKKVFRLLAYGIFILSIILLAVVNFITVWITLALFALIFFIYVISFDTFSVSRKYAGNSSENLHAPSRPLTRKLSYNALALLIISFIFIISGSTLGAKISGALNITSVEVRPAWVTTGHILKEVVKSSPFFGTGPNAFSNAWLKYKPLEINESIFWNTEFASGVGLIPSFFVTTGILGVLAWLFFFVILIWMGMRALFHPIDDSFSRYLLTSSFLASVFLWVMSVVYVPSVTIFALAFIFTGFFAASLYREKILGSATYTLTHHPKISFISVLLLVMLLLGNLVLGYAVLKRAVSLAYFQKAVLNYRNNQNLDNAERKILQAIELSGADLYYRGLSEIDMLRIEALLNNTEIEPEAGRVEFQRLIASGIEDARQAIKENPKNYQNWLTLARVYASLVPPPFSVPGAYDNAKSAYEEALKTNPSSPVIYVLIARLEANSGNIAGAREAVQNAIRVKSNYPDAHFFLAQIEVTEGNLAEAIPALETTIILSPENSGLLFQLGILKYSNADYAGAAGALADAVRVTPDYANAKYFLGLSLYALGEKEAAIALFEDLKSTNPDNSEVDLILRNIRAGRDPFTGATPPINIRPERRANPPIEEN